MNDDESLGLTFISDAQVAALAGGYAATRTSGKTGRQYTVSLKGVGICTSTPPPTQPRAWSRP